MASRDQVIREAVAELNARLESLHQTVDALTAALLPPEADPAMERVTEP